MYLPNPSDTSKMWHKIYFLKRNTIGFELKIFLYLDCLTKVKKHSLPN